MKRIEHSERPRTSRTAPLTVPNLSFPSRERSLRFCLHTAYVLPVTFRETLVEGLSLEV